MGFLTSSALMFCHVRSINSSFKFYGKVYEIYGKSRDQNIKSLKTQTSSKRLFHATDVKKVKLNAYDSPKHFDIYLFPFEFLRFLIFMRGWRLALVA